MNDSRIRGIDRVRAFVPGTLDAQFRLSAGEPPERNHGRFALISEVAQRFGHRQLQRRDKGLILRYVAVPYRPKRGRGRTPCVLTCTGL